MKPIPTTIIAIGIVTVCVGFQDRHLLTFALGSLIVATGHILFEVNE